jgi:hypothetical protein
MKTMKPSLAISSILTISLSAIFLFACTSALKEKKEITFKIKQLNRELTNADIDSNGVDSGDELVFVGDLEDETGRKGIILGQNKIIELPDSNNQLQGQARLSNIVFRFGNDQIIVFGAVNYPKEGGEIKTASPQAKAIIGGTGKYIGASGEVITTRLESGQYEHEFRLLN